MKKGLDNLLKNAMMQYASLMESIANDDIKIKLIKEGKVNKIALLSKIDNHVYCILVNSENLNLSIKDGQEITKEEAYKFYNEVMDNILSIVDLPKEEIKLKEKEPLNDLKVNSFNRIKMLN
jgi:hypothetical protein